MSPDPINPTPDPLGMKPADWRDPMNDQLYLMLGRLEAKVDGLFAHFTRTEGRLDNLALRVDALEEAKATSAGKLSGILTVGRIAWLVGGGTATYVVTQVVLPLLKG